MICKSLFFIAFITVLPNGVNGQSKKSFLKDYWANFNIAILYGTPQTGTGFAIEVGRHFDKGIKLGLGYSYAQFNNINKAGIINAVVEKDIFKKENKRSCFIAFKPGLAYAIAPREQMQQLNWWYTYKDAKPNLNLQLATGIRWHFGKHCYYISAGYNITKYRLQATRKQVDFIPERVETIITHHYNMEYQKVMLQIGITL